MADIQPAIDKLLITEGGYANILADRGGETFAGISRRYWPEWGGWPIVDAWKEAGEPMGDLVKNAFIMVRVRDFYRVNFWEPLLLDKVDDQHIAEELFDSAVNCGFKRAVTWLQQALNMVGGAHLVLDGLIGSKTVAAVNAARHRGAVLKAMNGLQFKHYWGLVEKDKTQAVFLRGWLRRVWEHPA